MGGVQDGSVTPDPGVEATVRTREIIKSITGSSKAGPPDGRNLMHEILILPVWEAKQTWPGQDS